MCAALLRQFLLRTSLRDIHLFTGLAWRAERGHIVPSPWRVLTCCIHMSSALTDNEEFMSQKQRDVTKRKRKNIKKSFVYMLHDIQHRNPESKDLRDWWAHPPAVEDVMNNDYSFIRRLREAFYISDIAEIKESMIHIYNNPVIARCIGFEALFQLCCQQYEHLIPEDDSNKELIETAFISYAAEWFQQMHYESRRMHIDNVLELAASSSLVEFARFATSLFSVLSERKLLHHSPRDRLDEGTFLGDAILNTLGHLLFLNRNVSAADNFITQMVRIGAVSVDNITVNIYCGAIVQIVLEKKSHQQEGDLNGILCSLYLMMMGNQENDTKYLNAVVQSLTSHCHYEETLRLVRFLADHGGIIFLRKVFNFVVSSYFLTGKVGEGLALLKFLREGSLLDKWIFMYAFENAPAFLDCGLPHTSRDSSSRHLQSVKSPHVLQETYHAIFIGITKTINDPVLQQKHAIKLLRNMREDEITPEPKFLRRIMKLNTRNGAISLELSLQSYLWLMETLNLCKNKELLLYHHQSVIEEMVGMAFWSFTKRTVYKDETLGLYHMMAELNMKVHGKGIWCLLASLSRNGHYSEVLSAYRSIPETMQQRQKPQHSFIVIESLIYSNKADQAIKVLQKLRSHGVSIPSYVYQKTAIFLLLSLRKINAHDMDARKASMWKVEEAMSMLSRLTDLSPKTICNLDYLRYYRDPWIWEAICEYISSSLKLRKEDVPAGNAWMKVFIDEENKRLTVNNINNSLRA